MSDSNKTLTSQRRGTCRHSNTRGDTPISDANLWLHSVLQGSMREHWVRVAAEQPCGHQHSLIEHLIYTAGPTAGSRQTCPTLGFWGAEVGY